MMANEANSSDSFDLRMAHFERGMNLKYMCLQH
jgi:hypothetical protein